ncbi:MAG: cardiolipin synthase [Phycisphaeraceae bacterium]
MDWLWQGLVLYPVLEWAVRIGMVPVILRRRFPPATGLAWLTMIFFLPIVGLVVYLFVGVSFLGRERARSHRRVLLARMPEREAELRPYIERPVLLPEQENMVTQAEQISGNPIVGGNAMELLPETPAMIDRLVADIDAAERHVHLLFYIFRPDDNGMRVIDALRRAAGRGVKCRLMADAAGSRPLFHSSVPGELTQLGVEVVPALPVQLWRRKLSRIDLRNHRKIAVIDGRLAYTGSHNIVVEDYGHSRAGKWLDLSARFTGPLVAQLQATFLDDWVFETGVPLQSEDLFPPIQAAGNIAAQVVPTGPSHEAETFRRVLLAALNTARRKIVMTTPYLVPDEATMTALGMAVDRGAEVTIVMPARSDHPLVAAAGRYYYEPLMDMGVQLHQYHGGLLHAKTITVDDAFALLGSANIDIRSFYLNFEINVLLYGPAVTAELRFVQQGYLARSRQISPDAWRRRGTLTQYAESAAALASPLL